MEAAMIKQQVQEEAIFNTTKQYSL